MAKLTLEELPFLFLIVILLLFHFSPHAAYDSTEEANALLKWAASLQNLKESNISSWPLSRDYTTNSNVSISPCYWVGISCDHAGSVNRVNLTNAGLEGTLQEFSFSSFPHLAYLELSVNELSGIIPPQIGRLTKLIYIDLSHNHLSGKIPPEIGLLTNLKTLHLVENQLNGSIPQEIGSLTSLEELAMYSNLLAGPIPSSIGKLTNLTILYLYNNFLSGSIPDEIGNLSKLVELCLDTNKLNSTIPPTLGNLKKLTLLFMFDNQLVGPIPQEIGNLTSLMYLSLKQNSLSSQIPASLGNLANLNLLHLYGNLLSGQIPQELGNLELLNDLELSKNLLTGQVPTSFGQLRNLQMLYLRANNLSGGIPPELGNATQLGALYLSSNHIVGGIPKEIGRLTSLLVLDLKNNKLTGGIPPELGFLNYLERLDLSMNRLNQSIPESLGNFLRMNYLNLSNNELVQRIPWTLGNLSHLSILDLSQNKLSGHIPQELSTMGSLEYMYFSHNELSGSIPDSFKDLAGLVIVDVSFNHLEGPLPNNRAFHNTAIERLQGNKGLCGNVQGLQPCNTSDTYKTSAKRSHNDSILFIFIPIYSLIIGSVLAFVFIWKTRPGQEVETDNMREDFLSIPKFNGKAMYEEVVKATKDFDPMNCIGRGQISAYKAKLPSTFVVTVKKADPLHEIEETNQKEFLSEMKALTEIRHPNIVKLYAFCSTSQHSLFIYEYLGNGNLAQILSDDKEAEKLDWRKRINIVKGVAYALSYAHHDCSPPIIHGNITGATILLDSKYEARVSDFGTSKLLKHDSSIWTDMEGTHGYVTPEATYTMEVTESDDVYSFGVVALAVIKGDHPGDIISTMSSSSAGIIQLENVLDPMLQVPTPEIEQESIKVAEITTASMAGDIISTICSSSARKVSLEDIVDPRLPAPAPEIEGELNTIEKIARACLADNPHSRPTMNLITQILSSQTTIP